MKIDNFSVNLFDLEIVGAKGNVLRFSLTWTVESEGKIFSDTYIGCIATWSDGRVVWTPHMGTKWGQRSYPIHSVSPDLEALVTTSIEESGVMEPLRDPAMAKSTPSDFDENLPTEIAID